MTTTHHATIRMLSTGIRLALSAVFAFAAWSKLSGDAASIQLFHLLGMGSAGRLLIGAIEALIVVLLLRPQSAPWGALLGCCMMAGALIAHSTVIGWTGDFAIMGVLALSTTLGSAAYVGMHRKHYFFLNHD